MASDPAARELADDAAVLEIGGETLVITHDMLVEGVHAMRGQDPADIAWKLVAVNLSDLAGKGAEPVGVLLGHMLGTDDARFLEGLGEVLRQYGVPLLGGDTVRGNEAPRAWGCTAIGRATYRPVPSRTGARPGDALFVSGPIGRAMLGFEALRDGSGMDSAAYRRPRPRLALGCNLAPHVTAMMDISDGLLLDARRIALASECTVAIDTAMVSPLAPPGRLDDAMRWGDDYELLFTGPPSLKSEQDAVRIGTVRERGEHPLLIDGVPPAPGDALGYIH